MTTSNELSEFEYQYILRHDLASFIERSFLELNPTRFFPSQYIELLASKLEDCRKRRIKRLIVNLPPRSLKSQAVSASFVAWLLGHDPSTQIICASYGQDLADKHARDTRSLITSGFFRGLFPGTILAPDRTAVNDFVTTAQGVRMATSVGGSLTGRGSDFIILDDIMKPDEALSETLRKKANDWYSNSLFSRLNNKEEGVIIVVMQRLHQQDLVGEVMDREEWVRLSLPAIATEDESYKYERFGCPQMFIRKIGEALHPERESLDILRHIREEIGEYNFQSQYQQDPGVREGGVIKREWQHYYESLPQYFDYTLQSWDTASKSSEMSDYSVCTTWGVHSGKIYLVDVFRQKLEFPGLKRAVIELRAKYQPLKILIEDHASGTALIQALKQEYLHEVEAYKPQPGCDKYMRFAAQAIHFENGTVLLPREAPWLDVYQKEITGFPGAKHDDQVDSTSQALEILGKWADLTRPSVGTWPISFGWETC